MIKCKRNFGRHNEKSNILVCHPKGEFTGKEMNEIAICSGCTQKSLLLHVNRFHDWTDITLVDVGYDAINRMSTAETKLRESLPPIKACYLVPNALLYGTVRMYQTLIENSGVEVHASYDINELATILNVGNSDLTANN